MFWRKSVAVWVGELNIVVKNNANCGLVFSYEWWFESSELFIGRNVDAYYKQSSLHHNNVMCCRWRFLVIQDIVIQSAVSLTTGLVSVSWHSSSDPKGFFSSLVSSKEWFFFFRHKWTAEARPEEWAFYFVIETPTTTNDHWAVWGDMDRN